MSESLAPSTRDPRALASTSDLSRDVDFQEIELRGDVSEAAVLRARWIVPVRQPIVLISQIQRSGGHLVSRLFDGHPSCINHPHELQWGRPQKFDWPSLAVTSELTPDAAFALLRERWQQTALAAGGMPNGRMQIRPNAVHPFSFDLALREALFKALLDTWPVTTRRDVLDAYLTASFNAWLDYRGLYATPKRYVTAFTPRVTMIADSLDRFFTDYPDGHLVTIVRHPGSWLTSALRTKSLLREHGGDSEAALRLWAASTEASLQAAARFGDRVTIAIFEELIHHTQDVMTRICSALALDFHPCLTAPTFNGLPIRSNSFYTPAEGLDTAAAIRHRTVLSPEQTAAVEATALPFYEDVVSRHGIGQE